MTDGQSEVQLEIDVANQRHQDFLRSLPDKYAEMLKEGESLVLAVRPLPLHHWHWVLQHARTSLRLAEGIQVPSEARAVQQAEHLIAAGIFTDRVTLETLTHEPSKEIIVCKQDLTLKRKVQNVRDQLAKMETQIARALPKHMTSERMLRIVETTIQKTPALLDCSLLSLLGAVVQASQLGLEPDGISGQAYLVPFYNTKTGQKEVQLIPGYRGLMDLAYRSAQVTAIHPALVHERDEYKYAEGLRPRLEHVPCRDAERGEIVAAYAVATLKNGAKTSCWMWRAEIDKIREASKAKDGGPWRTHFGEMAKKTVIRRLCKELPVSIVQRAAVLDEQAATGESQELATIIDAGSTSSPLLLEEPDKELTTEQLESSSNGETAAAEPEKPAEPAPEKPPQTEPESDADRIYREQEAFVLMYDTKIAEATAPREIAAIEKKAKTDANLTAGSLTCVSGFCTLRRLELSE